MSGSMSMSLEVPGWGGEDGGDVVWWLLLTSSLGLGFFVITFCSEGSCGLRGRLRQTTGGGGRRQASAPQRKSKTAA